MTSQNIWYNTNNTVVRPGWSNGKSALLQGLRKLERLVPSGPGGKKIAPPEDRWRCPGEGDRRLGTWWQSTRPHRKTCIATSSPPPPYRTRSGGEKVRKVTGVIRTPRSVLCAPRWTVCITRTSKGDWTQAETEAKELLCPPPLHTQLPRGPVLWDRPALLRHLSCGLRPGLSPLLFPLGPWAPHSGISGKRTMAPPPRRTFGY